MTEINKLYDEANQLKRTGDLAGAVTKLEEILSTEPRHSLTHQALAVICHRLGQFEKAISHSLQVVEIEPNDAMSYTQLSVIYQRCGKIQEAEDAMARAQMISGHKH